MKKNDILDAIRYIIFAISMCVIVGVVTITVCDHMNHKQAVALCNKGVTQACHYLYKEWK